MLAVRPTAFLLQNVGHKHLKELGEIAVRGNRLAILEMTRLLRGTFRRRLRFGRIDFLFPLRGADLRRTHLHHPPKGVIAFPAELA